MRKRYNEKTNDNNEKMDKNKPHYLTKQFQFFKKVMLAITVILTTINVFQLYKIQDVNKKYNEIQEEITKSRRANETVLAMLQEVRDEQSRQAEAMQIAYKAKKEKQIHDQTIIELKANGINPNTDLTLYNNISVEDMDKIIDYYQTHTRHGTAFKNKGYIFIRAAKESGLNPIYLFAHAATESDYGMSRIATDKNNFYGIGAYDSSPYSSAYTMGDDVEAGIVSGAKWIKENYYDAGMRTLEQMNPVYCTNPNWNRDISSIANKAISLL